MKVLIINLEFDCANVGWNLRCALREFGIEAMHVTHRFTCASKDTDRKFNHPREIVDLLEWADVLHFNQWIWTHLPGNPVWFTPTNDYDGDSPFEPYFAGKRVFYHFHGGEHQLNPKRWLDECARVGAGVFQCDPVSSLGKWMPNVLDSENIPAVTRNMSGPLMVSVMGGLADTRRTNHLIRGALEYIGQEYPLGYKFFDGLDRRKALKERMAYHVSIDNTTQGFVGMWSWESMAMGQIVLSRLDKRASEAYEAIGKDCPIVDVANITELGQTICKIARGDISVRDQSMASFEWMAENYTKSKIVELYLKEYECSKA